MRIGTLLALLIALASAPALAGDDLEKDLRELQRQAESLLGAVQRTAADGGGRLDVARRKIYALASDQRFLRAVNDLWASPDRGKLLAAEGVFFVVIFLLRAWRQARASNWFTRILAGLFFTAMLWGGIGYAIPAVVLGEPYRVLVSTLWHVLREA